MLQFINIPGRAWGGEAETPVRGVASTSARNRSKSASLSSGEDAALPAATALVPAPTPSVGAVPACFSCSLFSCSNKSSSSSGCSQDRVTLSVNEQPPVNYKFKLIEYYLINNQRNYFGYRKYCNTILMINWYRQSSI